LILDQPFFMLVCIVNGLLHLTSQNSTHVSHL